MFLTKTDEYEAHKLMKELKNEKSISHDGISNEILKCCSPITEKYLVKAFNICLEERKVPQCMKIAQISSFFKKGDRINPENYRPISLLTCVSNFFEKLLYKRMVYFFQKNKLFSPIQFGFRSKRLCTY